METEKTLQKKWYKKVRYWIIICVLLVVAIFTIISIAISGSPMFVSPPQKVQEKKISLKGINADDGAGIKIYLNGNVVSELKADSNGRFNVELELAEGKNNIYAEATANGKTKKGTNYETTYEPKVQETVKEETKPEEVVEIKQEMPEIKEEPKREETRIEITNPVERIQAIIKGIGDFEVLVWDMKKNFAKNTTPPPYEVTVNSSVDQIGSCSVAKQYLLDVMRSLYSDEILKDKIERVQFSAWGHLRASLGAEDAKFSKDEWIFMGPSNYWKVTLDYKPYENEVGPINQRTWGVSIKGCK